MPASSEKQKKFFQVVRAAKAGAKNIKGAAKKTAKGMSKKEINAFADKPVKESFILNEDEANIASLYESMHTPAAELEAEPQMHHVGVIAEFDPANDHSEGINQYCDDMTGGEFTIRALKKDDGYHIGSDIEGVLAGEGEFAQFADDVKSMFTNQAQTNENPVAG